MVPKKKWTEAMKADLSRSGGLANGRERLRGQSLQCRNKTRLKKMEEPITCRKNK